MWAKLGFDALWQEKRPGHCGIRRTKVMGEVPAHRGGKNPCEEEGGG